MVNLQLALPDKNCLSANPSDCITIDVQEVRPLSKTFEKVIPKEDYENGLIDSVYHIVFDYHYIEKPVQLIKTTVFNPLDYENLNNIQMIYVKGEYWSDMREILCPTSCGRSYEKAVQLALRERGYKIRVDGVFDQSTRKALVDF